MPEQEGGGAESLLISFPSPLRIRQQLGHVSTNQKFKQELVPSIEQFGGQEISVGVFVVSLETKLSHYAEEHLYGMSSLALGDMPKIIDTLVQEEPQRTIALELWEDTVTRRREEDERNEKELQRRRQQASEIKRRLLMREDDLPRRLKKEKKKAEDRRNAILIDPSRLASNPNSRRRSKKR